jgi:hypothetical protein
VIVAIFSLKITHAELWLTLFSAVKVAATLAVEAILLLSVLPVVLAPPKFQTAASLVKPVPAEGIDVPKTLNDSPDTSMGCCEMAVAKPLVVKSAVVLGVCWFWIGDEAALSEPDVSPISLRHSALKSVVALNVAVTVTAPACTPSATK